MRLLTEESIADIATGAAILGAGGGGDPHVGALFAAQAVRDRGPRAVVHVDEIADDALVVPVAMIGAPTVANEKLPTLDGMVGAVEAVARRLGTAVSYTMPTEVGGINSLLPIPVASELDVPIVDGDLMGRAFPEIQMAIPTLYGIGATPLAMADEKGNSVLLETIDNHWTETFARSVAIDMGASAVMALYAMTGAQAKESIVRESLTLSEDLGRLVRTARSAHADPITAVCDRLNGTRLFSGKLVEVDRRDEGGFARMEVIVEGVGDSAGSTLRILSQNEHLVAERDGAVVATTPDLIMMFDTETGEPLPTESVRFGFRVTVVSAAGDPRYRSPAGLALVGPRAFGYDIDYQAPEHRSIS